MNDILDILKQGDLRSVGQNNWLVNQFNCQEDLNELIPYLFYADRTVVMRAADLTEKISRQHSSWLMEHKKDLVRLCEVAKDKELKWHLAQLVSRLKLNAKESEKVWRLLSDWLLDKKESKIVRVNALQALYDLSSDDADKRKTLLGYIGLLDKEKIASLSARIKKLK